LALGTVTITSPDSPQYHLYSGESALVRILAVAEVVNDEMSSRQRMPAAANRLSVASRSPVSAEVVAAFLQGLAEILVEVILTEEAQDGA
jgi:hypothetical protein